jgi:hypothetical protein
LNNRPCLDVIFEFVHELENFTGPRFSAVFREKQKKISEVFSELNRTEEYTSINLGVWFEAFEPIALQETIWKISKVGLEDFKTQLGMKELWEIHRLFSTTTFLFYTDAQSRIANINGVREKLSKEYFKVLKPYDEFNYLKQHSIIIYFYSKEKFDDSYESNWFYFDKDSPRV